MLNQIAALLRKDFAIEWRNRTSLNGLLLYMASTIFVAYLALQTKSGQVSPTTWNAVFWIILTFLSVNSSLKSFSTEPQERNLTYYFLVSAQALILSKMLYNAVLVSLVAFLGLLAYSTLLGNPVEDWWLYLAVVLVGSVGLSFSMTLTAAIAAQVSQNQTLMPILSLPVSIPALLLSIKASQNAMQAMLYSQTYGYLWSLGAVVAVLAAVSYVLFPLIWGE